MAALYASLDGLPHVKSSNGFIQVMKLGSSSSSSSSSENEEEEEEEEGEYEEYEEIDDNQKENQDEFNENEEQKQVSEESSLYTESRAADLDQIYATVDKSQTRRGRAKSQREQLEIDVAHFREKVSYS